MSDSPKLYLDSCCFIDLVKFRRGMNLSLDDDTRKSRENDCWYLRKICDAARDGALTVVTSMLTVAECTHVGEAAPPSEETQNMFIDFLTSGMVAQLVEPDIFVAECARALRWTYDIRLGGADAIHMATAQIEGCAEFLTMDETIKKQKVKESIPKLAKIGIKVLRPYETTLLPISYRQGSFYD